MRPFTLITILIFIVSILGLWKTNHLFACSTFKLQKGDKLIYGHNLNEGDIGVPGLIFINKRGIFKIGRTWSELTTKEKQNPSGFTWISRYGSVTFNNFGKDLPDGGMNETGLFIWEMNEDAGYPKGDSLPKLNQMSWMQFILDNCSTTAEAIRCAHEFEIDGWGWHFFVGDASGQTAAIAFSDGKPQITTDSEMPVPGLFNTPYKRELELLKYYKGFGGLYEPGLDDPKVPRFVKTAVMIDEYDAEENIVEYGFYMLDKIKVNDIPEWTVLFDVREQHIYFKTRINPEIKSFSMDDLGFSNKSPTLILNIDNVSGDDVLNQFHPYAHDKIKQFTIDYMIPIIPEEFFTMGGISIEEYLERISSHTGAAARIENQFFSGKWESITDTDTDGMKIIALIKTREDAVSGAITLNGELEKTYDIEHIQMTGNLMIFTFRAENNTFIEAKTKISTDKITMDLSGNEVFYGRHELHPVQDL
jgi:choloylglycine hydrolase